MTGSEKTRFGQDTCGQENELIVPVILCGGSGTRLWPLSRGEMPKQFLKIGGDKNESLLYQTVDRALRCSGGRAKDIVTVTLDSFKDMTVRELKSCDPQAATHVLGEPCARNTAAAIAYAGLYVRDMFGPDALMWVMPADHFVNDRPALKKALESACEAARKGCLTTFGIQPERPETGYGYIHTGQPWSDNPDIHDIARFVEKPDRTTAEKFVASGDHLWNSGMFVFTVRALLDNYASHAPEILSGVEDALAEKPQMTACAPVAYKEIPPLPFDIAIMEKTGKAAVIPCNPQWSDIGAWESVWDLSDKDKDGNVLEGRVACAESKNCLVQSNNLLIAAAGLEDLVISEQGDSILIAHRSKGSAMKKLVGALQKAQAPELVHRAMEERPWGRFRVLSAEPNHKVKEITVLPGHKLSLQMHNHRCEIWTVVSGLAKVRIGNEVTTLKAGEHAYIPVKTLHRLENCGQAPLVVVEVQSGSYLGEDDIVRFDDVYDRATAAHKEIRDKTSHDKTSHDKKTEAA